MHTWFWLMMHDATGFKNRDGWWMMWVYRACKSQTQMSPSGLRQGAPNERPTEIGALQYPPARTKTTSSCDLRHTPNCKVLPQTVPKRGLYHTLTHRNRCPYSVRSLQSEITKLVWSQCHHHLVCPCQTSVITNSQCQHHFVCPCHGLENGEGAINKVQTLWFPSARTANKLSTRSALFQTTTAVYLSVPNHQKFKDSGCALSSTPSSILLSDLSNEQIRKPRKALLLSLLLKSYTRLQHPFVWHVSNSRVLLVDFSCSIALQINR